MATVITKLLTAATAVSVLSQVLKASAQTKNIPGGASGGSSLNVKQGQLNPADAMPAAFFESSNPTRAAAAAASGAVNYQYPATLQDYYVQFKFHALSRTNPTQSTTEKIKSVIKLPIPSNLIDAHNMSYADKQIGLYGVLKDTGLIGGLDDAFKGKNVSEGRIREIFKELGQTVSSGEAMTYAARAVIGSLNDAAGTAFERYTGTILNPFQALQFQGINLREHTFTYKFSPNSPDESRELRKIIKEFKIRMHPEEGTHRLTYTFPDVCDISFGPAIDNLYFIKKCFLKSMSVNFAPQGTPAFFAETREPVEMEITLNFGEIEPWIRDDVVKNFAADSDSGKVNSGESGKASSSPVTEPKPVTTGNLPPAI